MAVISSGSGAFDMLTQFDIDTVDLLTGSNTTQLIIGTPAIAGHVNNRIIVDGSFQYDSFGFLVSGTATAVQEVSQTSVQLWSISGFTLSFNIYSPTFITSFGFDGFFLNPSNLDTFRVEALTSFVLGGSDTLNGGPVNDYQLGFGGDDDLYGNSGSDTAEGGAGRDLLYGGDGNDSLYGDYLGSSFVMTPTALGYITNPTNSLIRSSVLGGATGFGENVVVVNDDGSSAAINITGVFGGPINFFGTNYSQIYVNNNGNLTFTGPMSTYTPNVIGRGFGAPMIAPFWADVDTRDTVVDIPATPGGNSTGSNRVYYDLDTVNHVFTATWDDVGYYSFHTQHLNAFQTQLIDRGGGNFDIIFRYEFIDWTTGEASGGNSSGLGGTIARAGFSAGNGPYSEIPASGGQSAMLALDTSIGNTGIAGVWQYSVRNGFTTNTATVIGNDFMDGGPGTDTMLGGDGNDTYVVDVSTDVVTESTGQGTDVVMDFVAGTYTLANNVENVQLASVASVLAANGNAGANTMLGNDFANTLAGLVGNDTVTGFGGDDVLDGGIGADVMTGGAGNDIYYVDDAGDQVVEATNVPGLGTLTYWDTLVPQALLPFLYSEYAPDDPLAGALTFSGGPDSNSQDAPLEGITDLVNAALDFSLEALPFVENITLQPGTGALVGRGNELGNFLRGNGGNNNLVGLGGDDRFDGGAGADTMNGGGGSDTVDYSGYGAAVTIDLVGGVAWDGGNTDTFISIENAVGSPFNDQFFGDGVANVFLGGAGNDSFNGGGGADTLDGGAGTDTLTYAGAVGPVTVDMLGGVAWDGGDTDTILGFENVTGSNFNDQLFGDASANVFLGGAGNDVLSGGGAADTLNGGTGTDTASYGSAQFSVVVDLVGGTAWDGAAGDTLIAMENATGGAFNDQLFGNAGANVLSGAAGNDILIGAGGADTLDGGAGTDTANYSGATAAVTVDLVAGPSWDGGDTDTLSNIENVIGSNFNDNIFGNAAANVLSGGTGNDTIFGGGQSDTLDGGAGTDTVNYGDAQFSVVVDLAANTAWDGAFGDTLAGFENATGGAFNDQLYGNAGINVLIGGNGNDTLSGGIEADTLNGGAGADTVNYSGAGSFVIVDLGGGAGWDGGYSDTLIAIENGTGSAFNDQFYGNALANVFLGGAGNDSFNGGGEADTLDGGAGTDTVTYASATAAAIVDLVGGVAWDGGFTDTLSNIENVTGSNFNDQFFGDAAANVFLGGNGNDTISGGGAADTLDGGAGTDTASYAGAQFNVVVDLAANTAWDGASGDTLAGFENAAGGAFNDQLFGNASVNVLSGNAGNDVLIGGGAADTLDGGSGTDTANYSGSSAAVTINLAAGSGFDGAATDTLLNIENVVGSNFNDLLTGSAAANVLSGGAGTDTLSGGGGADTLDGGAGTDTVIYGSASAAVTVDFVNGVAWDGGDTDTLIGIENATGGDFNDQIFGNAGINVLVGGAGDDVLSGGGEADTLNGSAGTDTANYGSAQFNVVVDLAANTAWDGAFGDTLIAMENATGGAFNDQLIGNAGANVLSGAAGNDILIGAAGADTLNGGAGTDTANYSGASAAVTVDLVGGVAWDGGDTDTLVAIENVVGSNFNDQIFGNAAANVLSGGSGNDTISGGAEADTLDGGTGTDTILYGSASAAVTVDLLASVAWDGGFTDTISGFENVTGSSFNDQLFGDAGINVLNGGAGNDVLVGGGQADTLNGGAGTDTAIYASAGAAVTVDLGAGTAFDGSSTDTLVSIENATGGAFNDTFTGDAAANVFNGGAGNDTFSGGSQADTFNGGAGTDTVTYASASAAAIVDLVGGVAWDGGFTDTLSSIENATGSNFNDQFFGDAAANVFNGGTGNDTLVGGGEADTLNGGAGTDTVIYSSAAFAVAVDLAGGVAWDGASTDTLSGVENVTGSRFNDQLFGDAGANVLIGGDGADLLSGGAGTDTANYSMGSFAVAVDLAGGVAWDGGSTDTLSGIENVIGSRFNDQLFGNAGANVLEGGTGADLLSGGGGTDTASYANASFAVAVDLAGLVAWDGGNTDTLSSIENAIGSNFNDQLFGDAGANVLEGGTGADLLSGGGGSDTASYANAAFAVAVDLVGNVAWDGSNTDTLSSIENVIGSNFNDQLFGNSGANVLTGGAGNDTLTGAAGSDRFVHRGASDGQDTITDFVRGVGNDVLDIRDVLIGYTQGVSTVSNFVQLTASGANTIFAVDADGTANGTNYVTLATLNNVTHSGTLLTELVTDQNLLLA